AATNKNLTTAINMEKFREDLYYRLNVIPIKVPSLKQRKSDIPLLIDFFTKKFQKGKKHNKIDGFSQTAMDAMLAYEWPGNVRELSFDDFIEEFEEQTKGKPFNGLNMPRNLSQRPQLMV
ncbi:MAG: sigma 54-interacting transcriptional regulator, partial [Candidatus Bathyarchaeota archaeon]